MFILSSDYDGTLKTRIHDLYINIREINKFRELGNIFVLNTGRPFKSIKKEIDEFNIKFDYLCCNDGCVTFDSNFDVVFETNLTASQKNHIKNLVINFHGFEINKYYSAKLMLQKEIENPIEIEIVKPQEASFKEFILQLDKTETNIQHFEWKNSLFVKNNSSKSAALENISKLIDSTINPYNIYTIGDEANDLEMIKNHRGFRMLESSPKLWFTTWRIVPEVHYLVKYLNYKSKRTK